MLQWLRHMLGVLVCLVHEHLGKVCTVIVNVSRHIGGFRAAMGLPVVERQPDTCGDQRWSTQLMQRMSSAAPTGRINDVTGRG